MCELVFFFFKQKTAYEMRISDWSSDVCSSDLLNARGSSDLSMLELGWQKFLGREYRLKQPHGLDRPLLVDASGGAAHGAHFTRCLPLSEDRILIEDVQLSELSGLDADEAGKRIDAYLARRGWAKARREREAAGAHPLAIGGDLDRKSTRLNSSH